MSLVAALLTDFGTRDNYVGVMKGVLLKAAPSVQIVDITHDISAQNVRMAAFQLMTAYRSFPDGCLFISVVDPGVGSDRKVLYAEADRYRFLAPDNGLLSWVFDRARPSLVIDIPLAASPVTDISRTFHGRDVFAPVAGRILNGEDPQKMGKLVKEWVTLPFPPVQRTGSQWKGEILCVDRFGNLVTNVLTEELRPLIKSSKVWFEWGDKSKPFTLRGLANSYSDVDPGKILAIGGSAGFVEISVRDGSAAEATGLKAGSSVTLNFHL